jgi:alanine-synthesizing transaminase
LQAVELLASLRLCANVPGQWAVQTALGGFQSIHELTKPGGRLFQSRQGIIDGVAKSRFLTLCEPAGAMYAFPAVDTDQFKNFDDQQFAMKLLESQHVLVAPGSSFNVPYRNHFRLTTLPTGRKMETVFERIETVLESMLED